MTEAEWLTCDDPERMLEFLQGKVSERKLRLFAAASFAGGAASELTPDLIATAERRADGTASAAEIERARETMENCVRGSVDPFAGASPSAYRYLGLATLFGVGAADDVARGACPGPRCEWPEAIASAADGVALVRSIFGNPFHLVAFSPDWRTDTVLTLARQMYESRDFSAMPILADALQDAGCDSAEILDHCRGPGPHVRGCWVVDWVLGNE
jgi:hypothetical protein